jgi:hypothetical protein
MFWHRKDCSSHKRKITVHLQNLKLVDIPPMNNRFFIKAKQGRKGLETSKHQISKTTVTFTETLVFQYEMPNDHLSRHPKPLRLSVRSENFSNSGFSRYGFIELDIMAMVLAETRDFRVLLANCPYNTYLVARLELPEGNPFPSYSAPASIVNSNSSSPFTLEVVSTSHCSGTAGDSSSGGYSSSDELFETSPIKVSRVEFDDLEKQVDDLLAGVIVGDQTAM